MKRVKHTSQIPVRPACVSHHILGGGLEAGGGAAPSPLLPAAAVRLPLLLLAVRESARGLMSASRVEQEGCSEGEGRQGSMWLHEASCLRPNVVDERSMPGR